MTQQLPPPSSKLRKGFIVVGIALLVLGFFSFYLAGRIDYDYESVNHVAIQLVSPVSVRDYDFGSSYEFAVSYVLMHDNDVLIVENNGSVRTVLWDESYGVNPKVLTYSEFGSLVYYKNNQDWRGVRIYLTMPTAENLTSMQSKTVLVIASLHHYERPHWILFAVGVVLSSLALVSIFKSRKQA